MKSNHPGLLVLCLAVQVGLTFASLRYGGHAENVAPPVEVSAAAEIGERIILGRTVDRDEVPAAVRKIAEAIAREGEELELERCQIELYEVTLSSRSGEREFFVTPTGELVRIVSLIPREHASGNQGSDDDEGDEEGNEGDDDEMNEDDSDDEGNEDEGDEGDDDDGDEGDDDDGDEGHDEGDDDGDDDVDEGDDDGDDEGDEGADDEGDDEKGDDEGDDDEMNDDDSDDEGDDDEGGEGDEGDDGDGSENGYSERTVGLADAPEAVKNTVRSVARKGETLELERCQIVLYEVTLTGKSGERDFFVAPNGNMVQIVPLTARTDEVADRDAGDSDEGEDEGADNGDNPKKGKRSNRVKDGAGR